MSGVPSSSRHPHSVIHRVSRSSARTATFGTSYRPSGEAAAGRTSIVASLQHTGPYERLAMRTDQWAISKELGSHKTGSRHVRRALNYSSTGSRAEDSERIISELHREIHDFRQEARDRSPVKERPRNRINVSKRKNPEYSSWSPDSRCEDCAETSCTQPESSLGEVALRWFNQLGKRTIKSWIQMAEAFVARFITNSRRTREMDALLTMKLEDNETIKDYSTRFWETYNDIDKCCEEVAVRTFKLGHLDQYVNTNLTVKKETGSAVRQPDSSGAASARVIHVIHNPLCSSILPSSYSDLKDIQLPHNNPLVIIKNWKLRCQEGNRRSRELRRGEPTRPLGKTILPVLAGPINLQIEFIVVKALLPYNSIMGRDWLHRMRAVPSTLHQKLRFPIKDGIMELNGD
uniref:Retrotransposon gag domain-containing protein n=1 Tax=Fagus sylvatica TaxID=28930 RepID=A0A2N9GKU8_FAGSY